MASPIKEGVTRWRAEDICARWALPQDSNPSTALVAQHLSRLIVALESPKASDVKQALINLGNLRDALAAHAEHFEQREPVVPKASAKPTEPSASSSPVRVLADSFEWDDPRASLNDADSRPIELESAPTIVSAPTRRARGSRVTDPKALELAKRLGALRNRKDGARV